MNPVLSKHRDFKYASIALAAFLAACGGGGDDSSSGAGGGGLVAPPVVVAQSLTLHGNAATGAAIAGQPVVAKCSVGTGTATSGADGSYTLSITSGTLPCMLKVTASDGTALFSVASGSGDTAVANINPVTQLVIASLSGADPATYFTSFDATAAAAVTTAKLSDAVGAVKTTLLAAGLDLSAIDVLGGTLTPATSTTAGNVYDQALDALAAKLTASGTTLADLSTTVAAASTAPTAPSTTTPTTGAASLPANLLLLPKAASCSALRSGSYRIVNPAIGVSGDAHTGKIVIDAATLAVTFTDGSTGTWAVNTGADATCHFTDDAGRSDIVVSQAGVLVVRHLDDDGQYRAGIAFPEQTHTLAELAGTWNVMGMATNAAQTAQTAVTGTMTIDGAGVFSAVTWCQNDATWNVTGSDCFAVDSGLSTLAVNATAGFDLVNPGGRFFAYQAGNGDLMGVEIDANGGFLLYTKRRTLSLPAVGALSKSWNVAIGAQLTAPNTLSLSSNTIASVDTVANSWVRTQHSANGAAFDYNETLNANTPRNGFTQRPAATTTAVNGSAVTIREFDNMSMRGMGFSPLVVPSNKTFTFSVGQP